VDNTAATYKQLREWFEFAKDNIKSMLTQILNSKELTGPLGKISPSNRRTFQRDIDNLVDHAIDKEINYYIQKYKVKSKEDYANILDKLSAEQILEIKSKCCQEVIAELNEKNAK